MYNFPDFTPLFKAAFYVLCVSVPLAAWKLIEIAVWLFKHINISFQ